VRGGLEGGDLRGERFGGRFQHGNAFKKNVEGIVERGKSEIEAVVVE
jgi:hypothetical protein